MATSSNATRSKQTHVCDECGRRMTERQANAAMASGCPAGCSGLDVHEIFDEPMTHADALRAAARELEHNAEYNVNETFRMSAADQAANNRLLNRIRDLYERADEAERPQGVKDADERDHVVPFGVHESDVLRDQARAEAKVLAEAFPATECPHRDFVLYEAFGSKLDDTECQMGFCRDCQAFVAITQKLGGSGWSESRPFTAAELEHYAAQREERRAMAAVLEEER